jgi:hypothetical protein
MVTVHRAFGFRFVILTNDHSPPHVHIFGAGGEAKITLEGAEGLALDWVIGIGHADMRRIMREVERMHPRLLQDWKNIHG